MHRLWYDLRSQSLFEEAFRDDVAEIDKSLEDMVSRVASGFASLDGRQPMVSRGALYAVRLTLPSDACCDISRARATRSRTCRKKCSVCSRPSHEAERGCPASQSGRTRIPWTGNVSENQAA